MVECADKSLHLEYKISKERANIISMDDYSIYNYFKNHPGVLITCISFISAFGVSIAKLGTYIVQVRFCDYWNIDISYIKRNDSSIFYFFCVIFIYLIVFIVLNDRIQKNADLFHASTVLISLDNIINNTQIRMANKDIERNAKFEDYSKFIRDQIWFIRLNEDATEDDIEWVAEAEKRLRHIEPEIGENYSETDYIKSECLKLRKSLICDRIKAVMYLIMYGIAFTVVLWIMLELIVLMQSRVTTTLWQSFIGACLISASYYAISILKAWLSENKEAKDFIAKHKRDCAYKEEDFNLFRKIQDNIVSDLKKKDKNPAKTLGMDLSNQKVKAVIITVVIVAVIFLFMQIQNAQISCNQKKDFNITDIDGQSYAIVYNNGDEYILEKAKEEGQNLVIYTQDKRVIRNQDISYEYRSYDMIEIKRS